MIRIHDFHGGVYPPERKSLSNGTPIRSAGIPDQLVLLLGQHIGPPAQAIVAPGDRVLGGQRLTDLSGLPLHAPTSGTVAAIEARTATHASGLLAPAIIIDCDGNDEWVALEPWSDYRERDAESLRQRIFEAGIAGLGGAGFPTARKLNGGATARIDTLIINGTECEPYITADDTLMRERATALIGGVEIFQLLVAPQTTIIGVEDNKPEAIAALREALADRDDIELAVFPTKYPSGGEKQLIELLTGKQVPSGGLPGDIGILCQNVGTAVAVHDAIVLGRPLVSRVTTVTGECVENPGNFDVLLGTPMRYLLTQSGYAPEPSQRLIMGGPMMGVALPDLDCPIIKTSNCLLVPAATELPGPEAAQACIRCGHCAEVCPARLLPQQLYWFSRSQDLERLEEHHLFDCIECGACSWVCPSHIPLVQYYRASKSAVKVQREENARSEHARVRFEARQARVERAAAAREEKRAARKRAAAAKAAEASGEDPVKAAIERAQAKKAAADAGAAADPLSALNDKVQRIEARLEKAKQKLADDDGSDPAISAALEKGVAATQKKLAAARDELSAAQASDSAGSENPESREADATESTGV